MDKEAQAFGVIRKVPRGVAAPEAWVSGQKPMKRSTPRSEDSTGIQSEQALSGLTLRSLVATQIRGGQ